MEIRNFTANSNYVPANNGFDQKLSVNDFLRIMAAEMSNQTPFGDSGGGGGSKTDYITQMAQFTMLEQMGEMAESINVLALMNQQQYTIGLIGKEVTVTDGDEELVGIVEKVRFQDGYAVAIVNGKEYNLGSIISISDKEEAKVEHQLTEAVEMLIETLGHDAYRLGYPRYEDSREDYNEETPIDEVAPGVSE